MKKELGNLAHGEHEGNAVRAAESSFATSGNKGFHITFPNGLTLSTQFGGGNYGSNYDFRIGDEPAQHTMKATTVELAVFDRERGGEWRTREIAKAAGLEDLNDDVMGYVPMETWLRMFDATRAAKAKGAA